MEDKWLNEWQKKLDGYEATPPDGLWDGINKALEERCLSVPPLVEGVPYGFAWLG